MMYTKEQSVVECKDLIYIYKVRWKLGYLV